MTQTPPIVPPRITSIRQHIAAGTYETPARIDAAADRLLDVLTAPSPLPIEPLRIFGSKDRDWDGWG